VGRISGVKPARIPALLDFCSKKNVPNAPAIRQMLFVAGHCHLSAAEKT
jgi:hypothetical protein